MEHTQNLAHSNHRAEQKTKWVVILAAFTMVLEISFGHFTNSMALLADGWHMASHVFTLGLCWIAYFVARKYSAGQNHTFSEQKLLALSGFTSAAILPIIAIFMAVESFQRFLNPVEIHFGDAIMVAVIGLIVNIISAFFLHHDHHENHDHNLRSAYIHVLADGLTSLSAIVALIIGFYFKLYWVDCLSGILSSVVIVKWAIDLMKVSGKELVDFKLEKNSTNNKVSNMLK